MKLELSKIADSDTLKKIVSDLDNYTSALGRKPKTYWVSSKARSDIDKAITRKNHPLPASLHISFDDIVHNDVELREAK